MITQAADFLAETLSLDTVLAPLDADDYGRA